MQRGNPVWLNEVSLAIGDEQGTYQGVTHDWLYWYNKNNVRFLTPEERAVQAEQRAQRLAAELRLLGVNPDALT